MKLNRQLTVAPRSPSHEQIQRLAYEIWQNKGCPIDRSLDCWLEAERKLTSDSRHSRGTVRTNRKRTTRGFDDMDTKLDELLSRTEPSRRPRSPTAL